MTVSYGSAYWPYRSGSLTYNGEPVRLRQSIMTAIVARLGAISTANDYLTALGSNVYEWKTTKWESSDLPGVTVKDMADTILSEQTRGQDSFFMHSLRVQVELATSGSTSMTAIRQMIGDVYRAVWLDATWGGLAIQTLDAGNEIATEKEEYQVVGATISLDVIYRTGKFQEG